MIEIREIEVRIERDNGQHIHVIGTQAEVDAALARYGMAIAAIEPPKRRRKATAPPEDKAVEAAEDK